MDKSIAVLCDAAEEWAELVDAKANEVAGLGRTGREAAPRIRAEAEKIRKAITAFRPLRARDEDGEWIN